MKEKKSIGDIAWVKSAARFIPALICVGVWGALTVYGNGLLLKSEIRSLFLFDWQFVADSFSKPGEFMSLVGLFFRQFLHLPWLGALIWTAMLYLTGVMCNRLFSIPGRLAIVGFIPAIILLCANTSVGYLVFLFRVQDYFFAPTLGILAALTTVGLARKIKSPVWTAIFLIVIATGGYSLAGYYAVAALLATGTDILTGDRPSRQRYSLAALALVLAAAAPLLISLLYTSVRLDRCWLAGLPSVSEITKVTRIRMPYIAASLVVIILPFLKLLVKERETTTKDILIQAAATVLIAIASASVWFNDPCYLTELKVEAAAERQDWQSIPGIIRDAQEKYGSDSNLFEPTRILVLMKDMALFKQGKEGDIAFTFPEGGRDQKRDFRLPITCQAGQQLYLNWGIPNYCHRWCVETAVEYGWSYETLKNISMAAMASGEWKTASMYLNILTKTMFYRKWAKEQLAMCANAETVAQAEPYRSILPLMKFENSMTNDEAKIEKFMLNHFTVYHPDNASPEYDRAALFWAARSQDIHQFWLFLYHYVNSNSFKTIPKHYQEAIYLYNNLEATSGLDIPVDKSVSQSYKAFMDFVKTHPVNNLRDSWETYYPRFGNTFYYYYYFIRDIDTY